MSYTKFLIPLFSVICFVVGRYSVPNDSLSHDANIVTKATDSTSLKKESANATERLNRTDILEKASLASSITITRKVRTNHTPDLDEECQQFLSLLAFVDSWDFQPVRGRKKSSLYLVSLATDFIHFDDREDELYQKLKDSYDRIETARQRFQADPSAENEVMLTCWLLLHGEFLTLAPIRRVAGSLIAFEEGEKHLESIGKWEQDQLELLQQNHPAALFLLGTIKARNHVFLTAFNASTETLIDENKKQRGLLSKYRTLLQSMLKADTAFHLGDQEEAQKYFKEATEYSKALQSDVVQFDKGRKPFLFVNEPVANVRNPMPLDFIDDTKWSTIIPTIASLAKLRFLQQDRSQPQNNLRDLEEMLKEMVPGQGMITNENPLGYFVRGLVQEERVTLLLQNLLEAPQNANAGIVQVIEEAQKSAVEALQKAQTLIAIVEPDRPALVSLNHDDSILAALTALPPLGKEKYIHQVINTSLDQLQKPEKSHSDIYDDLKSAQHELAWDKAEQYLLHHGTRGQAWRDYILTGIRTRQKSDLLKENYRLAKSLQVFSGKEAWQHDFLAGRIALYSGREILGEERQFIKALLLGDQDAKSQENKRLEQAEKYFRAAVTHFDQSMEHLKVNQSKVDRLVIRSLRAQAGALRLLVSQEKDPIRLTEFLRDAEIGQSGLKDELKNTPKSKTAARIDLLEALAKVQQAQGILLLLEGEADELDTALSALAASNDVIGRLKFEGGATLEQGTLLLSGIYRRNPKFESEHAKKDSRMRRVLQMLVEGLVMGDLGNPEEGLKRIDQANSELYGKVSSPSITQTNQNPSKDIWDLLYDDPNKIDLNSANKIVHLSGMLLQLKQSATRHSRTLGDILAPTPVEANITLASALTLLKSDPLNKKLSDLHRVLNVTRKPVESLSIALAAESKARSLGFVDPDQRAKWLQLAKAAIERSKQLQREDDATFNVKYPLLAQLRREMSRRLDSSDSFIQRSELAASRFRFDEAEERYRDGIAHHPREQKLWSNLATLVMTRLEVDDFSDELNKEETTRVKNSLAEILSAWDVHRPEDGWERNLLQARFLVLQEKYDEAIDTLETARLIIPSENKKAKAIINSKLAELVSSRQIRRISVPVQQEITSITTSQINHKE